MIERPILGISMGDPFGNGPEISVKALHDPALYDRCRPLLVGDRSSMEYALKTAKKSVRNRSEAACGAAGRRGEV